MAADYTRDITPGDWLLRLDGIDAVVNAVGILNEQGRRRSNHLSKKAADDFLLGPPLSGVERRWIT